MLGNRGLGDIGSSLAKARADKALRLFSKGSVRVSKDDVRAAHSAASRALEAHPRGEFRKRLGIVFYSHGKLLTGEGKFQAAVRDFQKALDCDGRNKLFRRRLQAARDALKRCRQWTGTPSAGTTAGTDFIRRKRVIEFCDDMKSRRNASIESLPQEAVLHYVCEAGYIHRPSAELPVAKELDEFHALGTYRWRGDEKASDTFSRWIRRMKDGERTVARNLGGLLADWTWSRTNCARDADFLVAVPGAPHRENERGFNPPEELAQELECMLGIPFLSQALSRVAAPRSREIPYEELRRSFKLGKIKDGVKDRCVLLVDDVATRGRTLLACSKLLRDAGAMRVVCVVLAQAVTTHREELAADAPGTGTA